MSGTNGKMTDLFNQLVKQHGEQGIIMIVHDWEVLRKRRDEQLRHAKTRRIKVQAAMAFVKAQGITDEQLLEQGEE